MGDWHDTVNHRPGVRPDMRMVGDSIVLVMPVLGALSGDAQVNLILRFDPEGEVFAALDLPRIELPKL
jgi:hypothetical protein